MSPPKTLAHLLRRQQLGTGLRTVFRVWGYQNPQLISVEATVLWGWVRTLDLAPCRATGNHEGLFTHLAEVESWPGLRGLRLRPRARGAHADGRLAT